MCIRLSFPEGNGSYYLGKDAVLQQCDWEKALTYTVFFVQIFMILAFGALPDRILTPLLLPAMLL